MAAMAPSKYPLNRYLLFLLFLGLITINKALDFQPFPDQDIYTRTDYGVIFRPIPNTFVPTDSYFHVFFELPFPVIPVFPQLPTVDDSQCQDHSQSFSAHLTPTVADTHRHFYELLQPALRRAIKLSPYNPSAPAVQNHFMDVYTRFLQSQPASEITNHYRSKIQTRRQSACIALTTQLNATLSRYSALRSDVHHLYTGLRHLLRDNSFSHKASRRTYRAILSFLAPAFQSILGLATEDQITQVQDNLLKLQNNQYAINNDTERLYSQVSHLANVTNRRIDVIWSGLTQQAASVNRTIDAIHTLASNVSASLATLGQQLEELHSWSALTQSIHEQALHLYLDVLMV